MISDKNILEIEYKYNLEKLIQARNLTMYAFQTAGDALLRQLEYEDAFREIQKKLEIFNQIEDCERKVNNQPI